MGRALDEQPHPPACPGQGVRGVQRLDTARLRGREVEATDVEQSALTCTAHPCLARCDSMATTASAQ